MELGEKFSWRDIEEAALYSPVLYAAVTRVRRGDLTQEQALVGAVLTLQRISDQQHSWIVDHMKMKMCGTFHVER